MRRNEAGTGKSGETGDRSIPVISATQTRAALSFDMLIEALRRAFAGAVTVPARVHHHIHRPDCDDGVLLLMPAWNAQVLGTKIAAIFPGNGARGLPSVHSTYLLCDAATGAPLAVIDGNEITARRTIAASALAASFLAGGDAESLLVVGAGRIGALAAAAFGSVRPIRRVAIWNRNPVKAARLAGELAEEGMEAAPVATLADAAAQADIITCATPSTEPIIRGEWLKPGVHLDLIGSFTPAMREADDACFARGSIWIDTPDAFVEAGDLTGPIAAGMIGEDDIRGTLGDLCAGRASFGLETPCGVVRVEVEQDDRGALVAFESVESFASHLDRRSEVPGFGTVAFDVAFGGAYYAILPASRIGLSLMETPLADLVAAGVAITDAARAAIPITHPTEPDLGFLYGTILTDDVPLGDHGGRPSYNLCIFAQGQIDRSPTGSGVTARIALAAARGEMAVGQACEIRGVSGEGFTGTLARHEGAVSRVRVAGRSHYAGRSDFIAEPADRFADGFELPACFADLEK